MTKRGVWVFIGLVAILGALIFAFSSWRERSTISFIERNSQVDLPSNVSQLDVYDNLEFAFVAHMKLPDEAVGAFVENNGFSPELPSLRLVGEAEPVPFTLDSWTSEFFYLEPSNQTISANADLQFLVDRCGRFALDTNSGRLWVHFRYPDRSGDIGC